MFVIVYSKLCAWWTNPAGQTIVALDALLAAAFVPRALELGDRDLPFGGWYQWVSIGIFLLVPLVIVYRTVMLMKQAHDDD